MTPDLWTAAEQARDEAIARVDANADAGWKAEALRMILVVGRQKRTFIADDVWDAGLERPDEGRALGAILQRAHRLGYIEPTGEYRPSNQRQCHSNRRSVWRSLVYLAEAA